MEQELGEGRNKKSIPTIQKAWEATVPVSEDQARSAEGKRHLDGMGYVHPSVLTVCNSSAGLILWSSGDFLKEDLPWERAADSASSRALKGAFVATASVLLVDDNPGIISHVRRLLGRSQRYDVVGALNDGEALLSEFSRLRPDVIVLDISMGELSGIDVARTLLDSGCNSKIVFLTVHEDSDFMNAAIGAGGSAYVVKSRVNTDLISAIEAALSGKLFVSPCMLYEP